MLASGLWSVEEHVECGVPVDMLIIILDVQATLNGRQVRARGLEVDVKSVNGAIIWDKVLATTALTSCGVLRSVTEASFCEPACK